MRLLDTKDFAHNGENYFVAVFHDDTRFIVRAFHENGEFANPYSYSIDLMVAADFYRQNGHPAVDHLADISRSDVVNNVWENYRRAVRRT